MKKKTKHEINGVHVCSVRSFVSDGEDRERLDECARDLEMISKRGRREVEGIVRGRSMKCHIFHNEIILKFTK